MPSACRILELIFSVRRDIPFLKQYDTKIIVNVCGKILKKITVKLWNVWRDQPVDMLEINISCPNVKAGRHRIWTGSESM